MRNSLKVLLLNLFILATAFSASGQIITNFVDWDHEWKYSQEGAIPAANWFATNYDDSAWAEGPGALGFPSDENLLGQTTVRTPLDVNDGAGTQIITYYFRTTFVLTTTNNLTLTASNLVDDGAVLYLNGRELRRVGIPGGTVTYTTLANRGGDISARPMDGTAIGLNNVMIGTNYLAVEVHQDAVSGSSDSIMAMKVVGTFAEAPEITQQPESQEVNPGQRATFIVTATGTTPLVYRWFSNNVLIATTSAGTYNTPIFNDLSANGAVYYVTVSNRLGLVRSANATLTVIQDVIGPRLISVVDTPNSTNRLTLTWNEPVLPATRDNRTNYALFIFGETEPIALATNIQGGTATSVVLTLNTNFDRTLDYLLCAYNISDTRSNITAEDCIGVGFTVTVPVFGFGETWRFSDFYREPTNNPPSTTITWQDLAYNDDPFSTTRANWDWNENVAPFRDEQATDQGLCEPRQPSALRLSATTYYFRKRFTVSPGYPTNASLVIRYNVDDGAVFYLNGTEIGRVNMPAGTPNYNTRASGCRESSCLTLTANNAAALLRTGANNNVLAVELHNCNETGSGVDATFDAELSLSYQDAPTIPRLAITRVPPTSFRVSWPASSVGFVLESATNLDGPWTVATPNPIQSGGEWRYQGAIDTQQPMRFFRLRNP